LWKPALYKKSRSVTRNANSAVHSAPSTDLYLNLGNILWAVLFGWWLALISFILSFTLWWMPFGGWQYSRVLRELSYYILWPFDKYVEIIEDEFLINEEDINRRYNESNLNNNGDTNANNDGIDIEERRPLLSHRPSYIEVHRLNREKKNLFDQVGEMGPAGLVFYFWFYLIIGEYKLYIYIYIYIYKIVIHEYICFFNLNIYIIYLFSTFIFIGLCIVLACCNTYTNG
jgi:Ca2+:H+ antiporter